MDNNFNNNYGGKTPEPYTPDTETKSEQNEALNETQTPQADIQADAGTPIQQSEHLNNQVPIHSAEVGTGAGTPLQSSPYTYEKAEEPLHQNAYRPNPYAEQTPNNNIYNQNYAQNANSQNPYPMQTGMYPQGTSEQNFNKEQYDMYASQNTYSDGYSYQQPNDSKPPKKKRRVAKTIGIIVLAICVAACGGTAGYFVANSSLFTDTTETTSGSSSEDSDTGSSESSSSLTIQQVEDSATTPTTVQEVVEKVADSVVEITTESVVTSEYYGQYITEGAGSGVIVSEDGYIITNNHVIEDASSVIVTLTDGTEYDAELIGTDSTADVALLKIDAEDLTPVTFADSDDLVVGQTAIAIGNPLGSLGGTVTTGIISALNRTVTVDDVQMNLLQTDAAINPGNSGGGLFDENGNLIGIVVAKSSGEDIEGLGFAIPSNDVVDVLDDLMNYGYVTGRPSLGVSLIDVTSERELFMYRLEKTGVYIYSVESGSCAETAGLQSSDCIEAIDGVEISSAEEAASLISTYSAGDTIEIQIYRDGETFTVSVTLDEEVPEDTSITSSTNDTYSF